MSGVLFHHMSSTDYTYPISLVTRTIASGMKNWSGAKLIDTCNVACNLIVSKRVPQTDAALTKITAPIKLMHCGDDIAYPIAFSEGFLKRLDSAGVRASLVEIPGAPHFGSVTHADL